MGSNPIPYNLYLKYEIPLKVQICHDKLHHCEICINNVKCYIVATNIYFQCLF